MESFSIDTILNNEPTRVLVIPDDCINLTLFHLVEDGKELCKLSYTEKEKWKIADGKKLNENELHEIAREIEKHFF